ncbi:MAG TPA: MFS transporter [Terriglobia bacterium]|nr:MFS transporter [Terriglobia bacterium]
MAAWGGWALDGMDSFIYALVLVPSLGELLPRSGIAPTAANVGYYGGLLFALFLVGWGCSLVWGPLADRFGRVRTLMLSILCYSLFTFLSALATGVGQLAAFRLLAGVGIGGEWSMGGTFVAEEWPEDRRRMGAGLMHTGYYFGIFLAAVANYLVGAKYGWRAMFALGGAPALLVGFIRYGVHEPHRWQRIDDRRLTIDDCKTVATEPSAPGSAFAKMESADDVPLGAFQSSIVNRQSTISMRRAFFMIFSRPYLRRTILNSACLLVSIVGLWAGSVYVPASVTDLAAQAGFTAPRAARLASYATMLLAVGTILGCLVLPPLAERLGRRLTLGLYFLLMGVSIAVGFGWVFYLGAHALAWFMVCLFFLGVGGANFAMYTLWLPEQYPTRCRASAFAFATSVGRFIGAGITFLVGAGVSRFHTIGTPVALTSLAFLLGLLLLPFCQETRGKPLPE